MKKYYLIIAETGMTKGSGFDVYISDNPKGSVFEFEAENYVEAQKKVAFSKGIGNGEKKYL